MFTGLRRGSGTQRGNYKGSDVQENMMAWREETAVIGNRAEGGTQSWSPRRNAAEWVADYL